MTALASSEPSGIDGGVGGPYIPQILAALSQDAGTVAPLDTSFTARARTAVGVLNGYGTSAVGSFLAFG